MGVSRETIVPQLKKAGLSDMERLGQMMTAYRQESGALVAPDSAGPAAWLNRDDRWPYLILSGKDLAGFVLVQRHSYLKGEDAFSVADFYLLPFFRGGGRAQRVIRELFEVFRGPWQVKWHPGNAAGAAFWQKAVSQFVGSRWELHPGIEGMVYPDGVQADLLRFDTSAYPSPIPGFMENISLRHEEPADYQTTNTLTRRAFWNKYAPGCNEHYLLHLLRGDASYLPSLSLVAEKEGRVIGGIWYALGQVRGEKTADIPLFGPVTVEPGLQGQGVGSLLIEQSLSLAAKAGYPGVIIFGDPGYYARFGFVPCGQHGITTAEGGNFDAFMVKELRPGAMRGITGAFHPPSVCDVAPGEAAAFDARYPYREKLKLPGQLHG